MLQSSFVSSTKALQEHSDRLIAFGIQDQCVSLTALNLIVIRLTDIHNNSLLTVLSNSFKTTFCILRQAVVNSKVFDDSEFIFITR